jgi:glycosyltransferase involved in cell wall biosynthesis
MSDAGPRAGAGGAAACDLTIVAHDIGPSRGMERQLTQLIEGLSGLGHRVTVIARSCELPAGAAAAVHRVRGPSRPFLIAYPWFLLAGSIALRRRRRGLVQATGAIVLGRVDVVAVHYCHQVGTSTPSRSTPLYRAHSAASGVLRRAGERLCFRRSRARAFVCVSEGVAAEVRRHYPELASRVVTIYNGIDTERFAPGARRAQARELRASSGIAEQGLLAAFVGSEWERKGLGQVLEALARVPDWSLLVAGEGDERRYRQLAAQLGVAERVRWLGLVEDVERVFDASDALVLASSYETFSLVTFEAAASGLAILATPVNGVAELIEDGANGLLITRDPEVIADGLRRLAADPGLRSRLGGAARESALAFGRERMVREHHELYERLASGREPAASAATVERGA